MTSRDLLWIPVFAVLVAFAVPWFMWGTDAVVAGLPVWLWWHVGWMVLAAACFRRFAAGAWDRGMGLDPEVDRGRGDDVDAGSFETSGGDPGGEGP
jgi:ribose/xylose/arabinose/galactoside ABC-type transport system permease subunit